MEEQKLLKSRQAARAEKDWKESDRLRDELFAQGIILEDKPDGTTTWRRK
jgi:cysteinyl-tRNA synthetase